MSDRGVILLLFDLPMQNKEDRRTYSRFRKNLKHFGFIELQESVYLKLTRSFSHNKTEIKSIQNFAPKSGKVLVLPLKLATFLSLKTLSGNPFDMEAFSDDFLII